MEALINKVKEYTADGPPGVGQLIELQDIAKTYKVTRAALEKLISESLVSPKEEKTVSNATVTQEEIISDDKTPEIVPERKEVSTIEIDRSATTYERPDLESARNSFDREMFARQELETEKIEAQAIDFENREEIVFPELNVSFGNESETEEKEKKESYDYQMPELPNPKESLPEIIQQKEIINEFETIAVDNPSISFEPQNNDFNIDKPEDVKQAIQNIEGITFEPNLDANEISDFQAEIEIPEEGEKFIGFEEALKEQNQGAEKEDVLRKIIAENKLAREKAERDKKEQEYKEKRQNKNTPPPKSINQTRDKYFKTDSINKGETLTLQQSKAVRFFGYICVFLAIATPFYIIGLIGGSFGMSISSKYKKTINENENLYGDEIKKAVNLSHVLFIISFVIGIIKLWSWGFAIR